MPWPSWSSQMLAVGSSWCVLLLKCFSGVLSHLGRKCLCLRNSFGVVGWLFSFLLLEDTLQSKRVWLEVCARLAWVHQSTEMLALISLTPLLKARSFSCAARVVLGCMANVRLEPYGIIGSRTSPFGCRWLVSHVSLCPCWMLLDCDVVTSACMGPTE